MRIFSPVYSFQGWSETLITSQVAGSALTAASAASALPAAAKFTLPANFFRNVGQTIRIKASGTMSTVITTPGTMRFDVRFGANVVFDSLAILGDTVAAHSTVPFYFECQMTVRVIGTSANMMGIGYYMCENILGVAATMPKADAIAVVPWNTAPAVGANFDSTATQVIDFFYTQTVATGSMTLQTYSVEAMN